MDSQKKIEQFGVSAMSMIAVAIIAFAAHTLFEPVKPVMLFLTPASGWQFSPTFAQVSLYGFKERECPIVNDSEKAMAVVGGELLKELDGDDVRFSWVGIAESKGTFPEGYVYPRPSRWTLPNLEKANKLGLRLLHNCDEKMIESYYWYDLPEPKFRLAYEYQRYDQLDVPSAMAEE